MNLSKVFFTCVILVVSIIVYAQSKTADQLTMEEKLTMGASYHGQHAENVMPYTVVGNVHSIGAKNIGVYLITTSEGHLLIDTGVTEMHQDLVDNVQQLGFDITDVKIILSTHAHFDHVQGHEAMRQTTAAKVLAVGLDADALRLGKDISPLGFEGWEPVKEVTTIQHGEKIQLGGTELTAHQIPGHTQGCTVWTLPVTHDETEYDIAIFGCRGPNGIVKVIDNKDFPDLIAQTRLGYSRLLQIKPDIYLSNHPQPDNEAYAAAIQSGQQPHPMLQQQPWAEFVEGLVNGFEERLK